MQLLSRVNPKASVTWGDINMMISHPIVATKIAECISEWADIESLLGILLGFLLGTDSKAGIAMSAAVENRSAQRRMLMAAAEAKTPERLDLLTVLLRASITPVQKQRDKLAHWCWAFSPELPDCLLLVEPHIKMTLHYQAIMVRKQKPETPFDPSKIYVVREKYLADLAGQLRKSKDYVTQFMACVWTENSPQ